MSATTQLTWHDDVLPGYEQAPLPPATLVRRAQRPDTPRAVALHVHGYNDHFFQTHVADAFTEMGCAFYAVDMRRAGRSLREGDKPHHITSIRELADDIGAAAAAAVADARAESGIDDLPLVVHAHSTGGLATAIWASDSPDPALAAVVLNSPFFGLVLRQWERYAMTATPALRRLRASTVVRRPPSPYTVALTPEGGGEWEFNHAWKVPGGEPATAGWVAATRAAQIRVARGLDIKVPLLAAHSDSCGRDVLTNPHHQEQDVVVDVALITAYAPRMGDKVEELVVDGGIHDLSLSAPGPRQRYLNGVAQFVDRVLE